MSETFGSNGKDYAFVAEDEELQKMREQLDIFIASHRRDLIGSINRLTKNPDASDDILQQLCVKLLNPDILQKLDFQNTASTLSYMRKAARNIWIDRHRSDETRPKVYLADLGQEEHSGNDGGDGVSERLPEIGQDPDQEEVVYTKERDRIYRAAFAKLSEDQRTVLGLRAGGYSYEEIADTLNKPLGTIKAIMNRGRALLAAELQGSNLDTKPKEKKINK